MTDPTAQAVTAAYELGRDEALDEAVEVIRTELPGDEGLRWRLEQRLIGLMSQARTQTSAGSVPAEQEEDPE